MYFASHHWPLWGQENIQDFLIKQRDTYRWLAELLDQLVFADPGNGDARALLANVYDQLGYQAESGPWRDFYLSGAYELRHGPEGTVIQ